MKTIIGLLLLVISYLLLPIILPHSNLNIAIAPIVAAAIITAVVAAATAGYNAYQQHKQQDWQKDMQREAWRREDNAVTRRVQDLKKAGLSPTLAAGSAATSSNASQIAPAQADMSQVANNVLTAISMEKEFAMKDQQIQLMKDQSVNTNANTLNKNVETARALRQHKIDIETGVGKEKGGWFKELQSMAGAFRSAMDSQERRASAIKSWASDKADSVSKAMSDFNKTRAPNISAAMLNMEKKFQKNRGY